LGNQSHPPYSPDLATSDFHLFGPMKVHLEGQICQTNDELKHGLVNWLCTHDKSFYAAGNARTMEENVLV
jgi:hypothetical protein